jgi:hypothetical protein
MSAAYETTFDESRPADLARSLRLMAATVPPDGTVEVTLTPVAARLAARSIEAGLRAEADRQAGRESVDDMIMRARLTGHLALAGLAFSLAVGIAVLVALS